MKKFASKRVIWLLVVAGVLVLVAGGLYLARGWIRGPFISTVITWIYAPKVDRLYAEKVQPINVELHKLGLSMQARSFDDNDKAACRDRNFSYFRETVHCVLFLNSESATLSANLSLYDGTMKTLARKLADGGWQQLGEPHNELFNSTISQLLDRPDKRAVATYIVYDGKESCRLSVTYYPEFDGVAHLIAADGYCGRTVRIFGGYY